MRVLMVGPAREVHGGVSAVINNYYEAGLDKKIEMEYLPSMKDGSKWCKLFVALGAYTKFVCIAWKYDIVHIHMASDSSFYRKSLFILLTKIYRKKLIVHEHGGNFREFYYESKSKFENELKVKPGYVQSSTKQQDDYGLICNSGRWAGYPDIPSDYPSKILVEGSSRTERDDTIEMGELYRHLEDDGFQPKLRK